MHATEPTICNSINPSCRTSVTKTLAEFRRTHEEAGLSEVRTVVSLRCPGFPVSPPQERVCSHARISRLARGPSAAVSWMLPKASAGQGQHFDMQAAHTFQCHGPQVKELLTAEQWEAIRDVASPASYFV